MYERGFTYLGILISVSIMGAVLAGTAVVWKTISQREKEAELLFIGHEFRKAIAFYYNNTPGTGKQYPKRLEDLLEDKRYPVMKRYLRKLYVDPMTGKKEWGTVRSPNGTIMGVFSMSTDQPIKTANFDEADKGFEGAATYQEWVFSYKPAATPTAPLPSVQPALSPGSAVAPTPKPASNSAVPPPATP